MKKRLVWILSLGLGMGAVSGCAGMLVSDYFYYQPEGAKEPLELAYTLAPVRAAKGGTKRPMVVAFHGAGQTDWNYIDPWYQTAQETGVFVLSVAWTRKPAMDIIEFYALIDHIMQKYAIDENQLYLVGNSAGNTAVQKFLEGDPSRWAGIILISSPPGWWARRVPVEGLPRVLYVHGGQDRQFSYEDIRKDAEALKERGADVTVQGYEEAGHGHLEEWTPAMMRWINAPSD